MAARFAARINGLEGLALTKMNALRGLDEVKIGTGYRLNGEELEEFPASAELLAECEPVYETLPGWGQIDGCNAYEELPQAAKDFVKRVEELTQVPVLVLEMGLGRNKIVSWGPVNEWLKDNEQ